MTRSRVSVGAIAETVAGLVMAVAMMGHMRRTGRSVWTNLDLIAATRMGPQVAGGRRNLAALAGFATHMATRALMAQAGA